MIERIALFIDSLRISVRAFEQQISASNGLIRKAITNGTDIQSKWLAVIADNYPQLDMNWLLTGRGSMLRDSKTSEETTMDYGTEKVQSSRHSKNSEETTVGVTPNATPISPAEESIIYKMYKDEKEEKERMLKEKEVSLKEKESKIDHLQSELLAAREELATLKAQYQHPEPLKRAPKSSDPAKPASTKQPSPPTADNATSANVL